MIEIMTIEEISCVLKNIDRKKVAKDTGLSYRLLQQFANHEKKNATVKTLILLSEYLKGVKSE